mmetsp:Transcript_41551/g.96999  ORF Transcript_41551/g.96999 Transcript_41551/m.96999 type:complete len:145 (-) Transcript_41551:76-510(-)
MSSQMQSCTVEGIWQGLKVFEKEDGKREGYDITKFQIMDMKSIKRTKKRKGIKDILGHYNGEDEEGNYKPFLDYIEARKKIYLPVYKGFLETHCKERVNELRILAQNEKIALVDYYTNGDVTNEKTPLLHAALIRLYLMGEYPE